MTLNENTIYEGDNGRLMCGSLRCAGSSAYHTGYTISGQRVRKIGPEEAAAMERELADIGYVCSCESCGKVAPKVYV